MSELRVTRLSEPVLPARPVKRAPQSARKQEEENWLLIYARTARQRWLLILTCTIVCAALSFVALLYQPVVYQGTATLEVLGLNEGFMDAARVDPQGAGNNGATLINMQTQLRLLRSGALLQRVVERLSLEGLSFALVRRDRFSTFRDRLRILPKEPAEQGKRAINMALLTGGGRILTGTRILEVSCESTSPEIAAAFVNTWVNEYLESSLRSRLQSAQKTGQWLTAQLDETKAKLEKAERELQNYANRSGITSPDQSNNSLADSKLQALQKDLASLQADRILKQTRMEKALMNLEALPDLSSDMGLRGDQAQLANLKREQSQLALTLTPVHPRMKALNLQIAALEDSLLRQREKIIGRIKSDYDLAVQSEKLLTSAYTRATSTLATQTSKLVDYNLLKREVDTTRQLYNTMLQQSNQANVVSALPTNTLRVVDYAGVPNESLRPRLSIFLGWGTVTGLFIGFLLALYRQNADSSISAPGIIATTLHMPELAAIPTADSRPGSRPTFALPWGKRTGMEIARPGSLGTIVDPNSFVAQSFHFAVSSLVADKSDGVNPRVIVVNSPHKAEGKTWITSNLAYALANSSRKVLLIDADLRYPRLHSVLGMERSPGLTDLLESDEPIDSLPLEHYIQRRAGAPDLLSAGDQSEQSQKLLYSPRLFALINRLRDIYEFVLIDSPPSQIFSDAYVLGHVADGVILVLRSSVTERKSIEAVRQKFEDDATPVLGAILNDWKPSSGDLKLYHEYYGKD